VNAPNFADPVWGWSGITARVCGRIGYRSMQTDAFRRRAMRAIDDKHPDAPPIQWWRGRPVAEGAELDVWADRGWGQRQDPVEGSNSASHGEPGRASQSRERHTQSRKRVRDVRE
jgi:hypothetical protein